MVVSSTISMKNYWRVQKKAQSCPHSKRRLLVPHRCRTCICSKGEMTCCKKGISFEHVWNILRHVFYRDNRYWCYCHIFLMILMCFGDENWSPQHHQSPTARQDARLGLSDWLALRPRHGLGWAFLEWWKRKFTGNQWIVMSTKQ